MATFVLVHGGWDGGWAWRDVARGLQAAGHAVFTPTSTGVGERVHLANPEIGLDTHIMDIVNVIRYEKLHDVILVGQSYGGMVITGVAERVPEQIRELVYLDAFVPQDGECLADLMGPQLTAAFEQSAAQHGEGWRVPHTPPDADRRTWAFMKAIKQPLVVSNPAAARLKRTCVLHMGKSPDWPFKALLERMAARARAAGCNYGEMPRRRSPQFDRPHEVATLLLELV